MKLDVTTHALVLINVLSSSHGHVTQFLIKNVIFGEKAQFHLFVFWLVPENFDGLQTQLKTV